MRLWYRAASIKFRDRDVIQTAHRVDQVLCYLDARLVQVQARGPQAAEEAADLVKQIKTREKALFGVFQQVKLL